MNMVLAVTVALGFAFACFVLYRLLRCAHAWELVDKTEFQPTINDYVKVGGYRVHSGMISEEAAERMSRRVVVLALRCPKCGAAKIFKETSA